MCVSFWSFRKFLKTEEVFLSKYSPTPLSHSSSSHHAIGCPVTLPTLAAQTYSFSLSFISAEMQSMCSKQHQIRKEITVPSFAVPSSDSFASFCQELSRRDFQERMLAIFEAIFLSNVICLRGVKLKAPIFTLKNGPFFEPFLRLLNWTGPDFEHPYKLHCRKPGSKKWGLQQSKRPFSCVCCAGPS